MVSNLERGNLEEWSFMWGNWGGASWEESHANAILHACLWDFQFSHMQPSLSQDHEGNKAVKWWINAFVMWQTNGLKNTWSIWPSQQRHPHILDLFLCTHHLLTVHIMFHQRFLSHLCCVFPAFHQDHMTQVQAPVSDSINPSIHWKRFTCFTREIAGLTRGLPRVHGLRVVFISPFKRAGIFLGRNLAL